MEECTFALAMAITRQVIPSGGRIFMENRSTNNLRDLRECWCDWVSGRQKGNFYKMMGSSGVSEGVRSGRLVRDSGSGSRPVLTCFNCGEVEHRAVDCKEGGARSPNVDRVTGPAPRVRPPTCFTCHKEGTRIPTPPEEGVKYSEEGAWEWETCILEYGSARECREEECGVG